MVLAAALALGVSYDGDTRAAKQSFPKMAKATYINETKDNPGSGTSEVRSITVRCDPGDKALSGGFDELDATSNLRTNGPTSGNTDPPHDRWEVAWYDDGSPFDLVDVFVLCSDFPPRHEP
jgi:hypothetical protein